MSKAISSIKNFYGGGLDTDSAPEHIAAMDYLFAANARQSGTSSGEDGYTTNIESTLKIQGNLHAGINKVVGSAGFEQIRKGVFYISNSEGFNQLAVLDYDANTLTIVFENLTDSAGVNVLPLTPGNLVLDIKLVNDDYLIWNDANAPVGFTNLTTLEAGGYGTVLAEDFSLIKPQCLIPPTGTYGSDNGQPANYLFGNLPQFNVQWVNADFNYSAWSTWSKRIVPYQQDTPTLGSDVTQNNYIIVSVNIGSERATTINIACRFADFNFAIVKSVDRAYVLALPNTSVDVDTEILEAYDPATNLYSFAFYNNDIAVPVNPLETDLAYDYIWPCGATEVVNGNIIANADIKAGYVRPVTAVTIGAVGYDPGIAIPAGTYPDPLIMYNKFLGSSGSGAGDHKRVMYFTLNGTPHTGDTILIRTADIRNAQNVLDYSYTVPPGQDGDLTAVVLSIYEGLPRASYVLNGDGSYTLTFTGDSYFSGQLFGVKLFFAGASVANSIPTVLDNTTYQYALSYRDSNGRFFPLDTDNTFIVPTPSYAQVLGQAIEVVWNINSSAAPVGAVDYQWMTTKPPITKILDTLATPLAYQGTWDAKNNTPTLATGTGTVGDTYQVAAPCDPSDTAHYTNLGTGEAYLTGSYVVYNGLSWDVLPKEFGDLTSTGNILAFSLNSLKLFNDAYASLGVDTILAYDFAQGDRCTLHYYIDGGVNVFINNPCVNLSVFGFDAGTYIVKVEKSATFDTSALDGKNVFLRLYSPQLQNQSASNIQNETVWYEIGERFIITDGVHDTLNGTIFDGGAYYKTRQFEDSLEPYTDPPINTLATDLNYSDFYPSQFSSFGRPRSYSDELEKTEREAIITWSDEYVLGSKRNGLTRFYPENVYGNQGGQTSANYGAIRKMLQINNGLIIIQKLNHGTVPVYQTVYEDAAQRTTVAVTQKIFNPIRYTTSKHIGVGNAKESIAIYNNIIYWIDPNRSQPVRWEGEGCFPISLKMPKYFKTVLQAAFALGYKIIGWYDIFNDEYVISIQQPGGVVSTFGFDTASWRYLEPFTIAQADITISTPPVHSTPVYNSTTGIVVLTPDANYVGSDTMVISYPLPGGGTGTKNVCFNWTAGSGSVNPFGFMAQTGVNLSTVTVSNAISVSGNDYPVAISITGDTGLGYSINGGAYTSSPGTVSAGDIVTVRVTSSATESTMTSVILTIDSQTGEFDVVTKALGNFTVYAQYGGIIDSVIDGTGTGVPAGYNPCNLTPGQAKTAVYTTLTAGTYSMVMDGSPVLPGSTFVFMSVNSVDVGTAQLFTGPGTYTFTLVTPANDPDAVLFGLRI